MSSQELVEYQMDALHDNNDSNDGIMVAYRLASPDNKRQTGPLESFTKMLKGAQYHHLLNSRDWNFIENSETRSPDDLKYSVLVYVISKVDGKRYIYRFELSRQYDFQNNKPLYDKFHKINLYLYWRTNSVIKVQNGGNDIEPFNGNSNVNSNGNSNLNIYGEPLRVCGLNPMTGYYRDGKCSTDASDHGTHTVCAKVTNKFLNFTKNKGNDLSSSRGSFPGLKDGDNWCLCAMRYKEALDNNIKMSVDKKATHRKTLDYLDINQL